MFVNGVHRTSVMMMTKDYGLYESLDKFKETCAGVLDVSPDTITITPVKVPELSEHTPIVSEITGTEKNVILVERWH